MDVELITANGSRSIDIDPVVKRYQHDIARSLMAEFLMLGSGSGSYALSKTKTDLFLRSLESYINAIVDVLNKQLIERLWQLNGLPWETMPKLVAGDVAPHDLREIASFLRNINGAGIEVQDQVEVVQDLMSIAEIDFDPVKYQQKIDQSAQNQAEPPQNPPV
jgi:phage gp29-like protein